MLKQMFKQARPSYCFYFPLLLSLGYNARHESTLYTGFYPQKLMINLDWILLGLRLLTTVVLYTFLGLAFYIIWRALKQAAAATNQQERPNLGGLRLISAAEPHAGAILPLQPVTLLGRDPANAVVVNDAAASSRHARISRKNGVWLLEDLDSQTGTMLNDSPLSKPAPLADGDVIGIGTTRFRVELV